MTVTVTGQTPTEETPPQWIPVGDQAIALDADGKIIARNKSGRPLKSVPAKLKKTDEFVQLDQLRDFLARHDADAGAQVQRWLLDGLPVPTVLLGELWADSAWRSWLTDLVIATQEPGGPLELGGFLREVTPQPGGNRSDGKRDRSLLAVVDLDGESTTIDATHILIPHPVLFGDDLDELREFAVDLGITSRFDQLQRQVFSAPGSPEGRAINDFSDAEFEQIRFAAGRAKSHGFSVQGGYAVCRIIEGGKRYQARIWIGEGAPDEPTSLGELIWVFDDTTLPVAQVPPVAYSEGMRMATILYAGRKLEKEDGE
ncbi:DUF4132 domain-containing protein [Gordonia amarae]|uniref:DUF4132 domain-containing protein n=2 Tax=Gordonia amarae TaxID=36821 RepID=G7GNA4_9ACTN|nr:DUF4132 domain-containing protein [Gordonia amarae]MCS3877139.1 hypothetical protein [Gordonia amarae]QHN15930.1 DUF4132 domain-containing protein [Gordonia amarae]QHN20498.1 DUF4132 domain-containing protein [Gordonia amarae]QHN29350.1 DUF4132 domain-containing protein [Gordonia amarae]QHN38129.1 DUF4132 domain-containing protein [Gordonia amarae]